MKISEHTYSTIAIIGVGVLGGSIGLALQKNKLAKNIIGIGRSRGRLLRAKIRGAVTEITTDLAKGVQNADLVIICTPVKTVVDHIEAVGKHCRKDTIITDVGSTKKNIVAEASKVFLRNKSLKGKYVGSHPMAGSERSGVLYAKADLFEGRKVVVTPGPKTALVTVLKVRRFWRSLGAKTLVLTPAEHDRFVASASHVPHLIATALAASTPEKALKLVAGGWLDSTRIAAGDIELWRQILLENQSRTLEALALFEKLIDSFRHALTTGDESQIIALLRQGKKIRDSIKRS